MNNAVQKMKCSSCVHCDVCSLKGEYLKLMDALPEVSGPFTLAINCPHYRIKYETVRDNAR